MTLVDELKEARSLVSKGFSQNSYARDIDGNPVDVLDPKACCFCGIGATLKVRGVKEGGIAENDPLAESLQAASFHLYGRNLWAVGDRFGKWDLLRVFDYAIAQASGDSLPVTAVLTSPEPTRAGASAEGAATKHLQERNIE